MLAKRPRSQPQRPRRREARWIDWRRPRLRLGKHCNATLATVGFLHFKAFLKRLRGWEAREMSSRSAAASSWASINLTLPARRSLLALRAKIAITPQEFSKGNFNHWIFEGYVCCPLSKCLHRLLSYPMWAIIFWVLNENVWEFVWVPEQSVIREYAVVGIFCGL